MVADLSEVGIAWLRPTAEGRSVHRHRVSHARFLTCPSYSAKPTSERSATMSRGAVQHSFQSVEGRHHLIPLGHHFHRWHRRRIFAIESSLANTDLA